MNRVAIVCLCLCLAIPVTGCAELRDIVSGTQKPGVSLEGVRLTDLSLSGVTLRFDVGVTNPYTVSLPVTKAAFSLATRGTPFLSGSSARQAMIPAGGKEVFPVEAAIPFAGLLSTVEGIRPGAVVPWDAHLDLSVDAPVVGNLTLPLEESGELPVPAIPDVSLASFEVADASLSQVAAVLHLTFGNTNSFPLDLTGGRFRVNFAGVDVGGADLASAVSLDGDESADVSIPIRFSPLSVGTAAFRALTGSGATYKLNGELAGSTPFGTLSLPFAKAGKTKISR